MMLISLHSSLINYKFCKFFHNKMKCVATELTSFNLVFPQQFLQTYELAPKTFWLLISNILPHWCKISRPYLVLVPNHWTWTKGMHPLKKWFFRSNRYKVEVIITSLIETLELPNLGHMTTSTIVFESRKKIWLVASCT